jgi:hypothetical protein
MKIQRSKNSEIPNKTYHVTVSLITSFFGDIAVVTTSSVNSCSTSHPLSPLSGADLHIDDGGGELSKNQIRHLGA